MLMLIEPNPLIARIVEEAIQERCALSIIKVEDWESARAILQTQPQLGWIVLEANLDGCLLPEVIQHLRTEQPQARLAVIGSQVDELRECWLEMGASLVLPTEDLIEDPCANLGDFLFLPGVI